MLSKSPRIGVFLNTLPPTHTCNQTQNVIILQKWILKKNFKKNQTVLSLHSLFLYLPPTKWCLSVILSVHVVGSHVTITHDTLGLTIEGPPPPARTYSNLFNLDLTVQGLPPIRLTSRRLASYVNAFLFKVFILIFFTDFRCLSGRKRPHRI